MNNIKLSNEALEKYRQTALEASYKNSTAFLENITPDVILAMIVEIEMLRSDNEVQREIINGNDSFLNAVAFVSKQGWDEALKKRIEELEYNHKQTDDAYIRIRAALGDKIAYLEKANERLEKEVNYLAEQLVDYGEGWNTVEEWRREAQEAINSKDGQNENTGA